MGRHRLFCSLVLSSSFLVEGCASTHAGTSDAAALPDDAGVLADPRACEPGWPTTKGIFQVVRDGLVYGCDRVEGSTPEMPDLDRCCVVGPAS